MAFKQSSWAALISCFLLGAVFPLGFAPFSWWPITWISAAIYMYLLSVAPSTRSALARGWWFGFGLYGVGASWVYISMHDFGYTPAWLAGPLTTAFVAGIALFFVMHAAFYRLLRLQHFPLIGFPASWVLFEWVRTWLLTGFPWLFTGYSVIETPFAKTAQIGGIFFCSWIATSLAGLLFTLMRETLAIKNCNELISPRRQLLPQSIALAALLLICFWASQQQWTQTDPARKLNVSLIQGNISQKLKWDPAFQDETLEIYKRMSLNEWKKTPENKDWHSDLIVWPEAAIPMFYHQAFDFIANIDELADKNNSTVISGIPHYATIKPADEKDTETDKDEASYEIHNSIFAVGIGHGMYHKQRLVPFGEYIPLEKEIRSMRGLIPFFDLPMSSFTPGRPNQKNLVVGKYEFSPFICYEIMYPDLVQHNAKNADFLLTVSNDAWFGDSIGPKQHFEMARFRALEIGKYLVRDTNTGITAIVDLNGSVIGQSKSSERNTLRGTLFAVNGVTPFGQYGSKPILYFCGLLVLACAVMSFRKNISTKN